MLDLPVRSWVCDRGPVHPDVVIIIEIQELFPSELSASIVDDGVRDSKTENDVLDEIHYLLGANISQGPCLDPLSQLVDHDELVGQPSNAFLKGPKRSKPHKVNDHVMGMVWSFWVRAWICLMKY
jgi:hypothetical protein